MANYKDDKKDGPYEYYHDNGQLGIKATYKDDKLDGLYERYYSDGQLVEFKTQGGRLLPYLDKINSYYSNYFGLAKPNLQKYNDVHEKINNYLELEKRESIPWGEFKNKNTAIVQKYPNLQKEITTKDGRFVERNKLKELRDYVEDANSDSFISYYSFPEGTQNSLNTEQVVFQLNSDHSNVKDEKAKNFINKVKELSLRSMHPVNEETIGWSRVNITNDSLLIGEIQSDFASVSSALKRDNQSIKSKLINSGKYTEQDLEKYGEVLLSESRGFENKLISSIIDVARRSGKKNIYLHSSDSIHQHKEGATEGEAKLNKYYDEPAKRFGFKLVDENIDGRDFKGIWKLKIKDLQKSYLIDY